MPPSRPLPLPHFSLPLLAGEDHLFVAALRSHLSASPRPAAASLSRFLPGLTPLRLSHLFLLAGPALAQSVPHDLLGALLPTPPPPLPFAILLHSLPPPRCRELLATVLPSVSPQAFPDLLDHVLLTARIAAGWRPAAAAVPALDVLFSVCARDKKLSRATLAFRAMRSHGLLPTVESCNVFISAAGNLPAAAAALSAEDRAGLVNALKDKLQSLAGQHTDVLEMLSPNVRKRVEFLREIQVWSYGVREKIWCLYARLCSGATILQHLQVATIDTVETGQ